MADIVLPEFPFVKELPFRSGRRARSPSCGTDEIAAVEQRKGKLIQVSFAADLMSVHRSRVHQLMDVGKLEKVEVNGHPYVTVQSVVAYCETERKAGRPPKVTIPRGPKALFKTAFHMAQEHAEFLEKK